jgi:zinc protease
MRIYFKFLLYLLSVVLFLTPANLHAFVKEYRLDNGLKVLIIEDHKAPLAIFQIWYRVGSRDEPAGKTGMSHLLEHMMFKGTHRYGSKVFSNIIQRNGGADNAFTTKDYTMYFQTLSSDRIEISVELEADRMTNLLLDSGDVVSERNVVMEERRMRTEDSPQNLLHEELVAAAFNNHPYRSPVIGWMSDIASIEKEDLYGYYRKYYSPDNAFIVVSGDVKPESMLQKIKKHFANIPLAGTDRKTKAGSVEPEQKEEKRIYLKRDAELPYILTAYHVPSFPHKDCFALEVLSTILSGGRSSRLYRSIVYEKKLAIESFADYIGFHKDPFLFLFGAAAAPGKDIEEVERAIDAEIEKIKREPPSDREMQKAKNQIEAFFIFAQDSNYSKAYYAGLFEILGSWKLVDTYLEGIRRVAPEDIQAVARKYFSRDNRTVGILIPTKKAGSKQ